MGLMSLIQAGEGLLLAFISAVGFAAFPNLARLAANAGVPDLQIVLVDELTNASVFLPLTFICRAPLKGKTYKQTFALIGTGVLRVCSTTMTVLSYLYIPPAATIAVSKGSGPLLAAILSRLIRKETTSWINIVGMVAQVAGVGLVAAGTHLRTIASNDMANLTEHVNVTANFTLTSNLQGEDTRDYIIGVALALAGTLGLATTNVLSRTFLQKTPQLIILFYIESLGFLLVFPVMYILNTPKWNLDISVVGILAGQGIIYTVSVACLYRSLKLEKASTVEILRGFGVAVAYVFQYLILHVIPLLLEYIGATVIIVSTIFVAGRNWYKTYKGGTYEVEAQAMTTSDTADSGTGIDNPAMSDKSSPGEN